MEMSYLTLVIIAGSREMTRLMHGLDVFEKFKVIGEPASYEIPDDDDSARRAQAVIDSVDHDGKLIVSAVFVQGRPDLPRWVNPDVMVISNGKGWTTLDKAIKEIDQRRPDYVLGMAKP